MLDLDGKLANFKNLNCSSKLEKYPKHLKEILDINDVKTVFNDITSWPKYSLTPLRSLHEIANSCDIKKVWYKDESTRFNLGSFKALGGAYAVAKQIISELKKRHKINASMTDLLSNNFKSEVEKISVSCATDGNHGRSVAWGAQLFGCQCVIYLHKHVSKGREIEIAKYGAKIERITGNYDDSVRKAANDAKEFNRLIVSDTSYPGYMDIPKDVALGYTVMFEELVSQLDGEIPTHIIIQGGVGGLASAACAYAWQKWQKNRPLFIIVEPENANCLQQSAINNKPTIVTGELDTLMAGLACGEVSVLAWDILSIGTNYFTTINEATIPKTMKLLAKYQIEAGESAVPGLAALITASNDNLLELNENSTVLLIGTEGATDPVIYKNLTGIEPRSMNE